MYRSVTLNEAKIFNTAVLIDSVLNNLFSSEPTNYDITGRPYPNEGWTTKNGFLKAVAKTGYQDICHLMISNENIHFSFVNWLLNEPKPSKIGYQEIEFYATEDIYTFSDVEIFAKSFFEIFPIDYGFIFLLPNNYDPSSERKIKKGFFSESVTVNTDDILWTQSIPKVKNGIIKNIYPINFINDTVFERTDFQRNIVENGIGYIDNFYTGVKKWTLKQNEMDRAKIELSNSGLLFKVTK